MNEAAISALQSKFLKNEALDETMHDRMMDLFRKYLLVGGLPDAVNVFLETRNIQRVREVQAEIHDYYAADASKYDQENKLKIRRVYDMIPSNMENKKKRVVAKNIEVKSGKDYTVHSALSTFVSNEDYHVKKAYVLSNERKITAKGKISYLPVYFVMFLGTGTGTENLIIE